jgi:hypothetical protein
MSSSTASLRKRASLRDPALAGAVGVGAFALLHFHDPHNSGSYGFCPFLELTGRPCPGCGGLRAINNLTRGDFVGAVSSNVMAVGLVGVLGVAWVLWVIRRMRGQEGPMIVLTTRIGLIVIAAFVVFGIVRNLPFGSWLMP